MNLKYINYKMGFPGGSVIKNPPAMQEMEVWSLGGEDLLEKEMATHSSIRAWKIPYIQQGKKLEGLEKTAGDSLEDRGKGPLSLPDWETAGSTLFWCWDRTLGNTVPCSNVETTNIPDEFIDFSKISR